MANEELPLIDAAAEFARGAGGTAQALRFFEEFGRLQGAGPQGLEQLALQTTHQELARTSEGARSSLERFFRSAEPLPDPVVLQVGGAADTGALGELGRLLQEAPDAAALGTEVQGLGSAVMEAQQLGSDFTEAAQALGSLRQGELPLALADVPEALGAALEWEDNLEGVRDRLLDIGQASGRVAPGLTSALADAMALEGATRPTPLSPLGAGATPDDVIADALSGGTLAGVETAGAEAGELFAQGLAGQKDDVMAAGQELAEAAFQGAGMALPTKELKELGELAGSAALGPSLPTTTSTLPAVSPGSAGRAEGPSMEVGEINVELVDDEPLAPLELDVTQIVRRELSRFFDGLSLQGAL